MSKTKYVIAEIKRLKGGKSEVRFKGTKKKLEVWSKQLEGWNVGEEVPVKNGKPSF